MVSALDWLVLSPWCLGALGRPLYRLRVRLTSARGTRTSQWHVRYGGRGIMIYWHVERKSLCIHSQLKSPSSSEVASMIEGVPPLHRNGSRSPVC